jgi:AraC-like DNA-binding protein
VETHGSEIEHVAAFFHGWPAEVIQLGPRSERTIVSCNAFRSHRILRLESGSALAIHGTVHKACSCILLSTSPDPTPCFLGQSLRVTDLLLAGANARMNLFIPSGAIVFVLVVPASDSIPPRTLRVCNKGDAELLIQYMKQHDGGASGAPLAGRIREAVAASQAFPVTRARFSAVMSACELIDRQFPAAPTVSELSQHSGVGVRTLEYGFRQVYGTTPLAFARALRLTRSRMSLLHARSYMRVNEIAGAFGYRHMGQFSRDYRRWFGEAPSKTLARAQQFQERLQQPGTRISA